MRAAYDIVGSKEKSVAILSTDTKNAKKVAKELMERHPSVKTVLKKTSGRVETFRLNRCRLVAGNKDTEVVHKEYGYSLKLDPRKVYFSPRESTERQRVAALVKPKEIVLAMFSGVSPYPIAIAKKQPNVGKIYAVEINPSAHEYAIENIVRNHVESKVVPILSDIRKARDLGKVDRITMPMVETAIDFIDEAFYHSKKGTVIHLYGQSKDAIFKDLEKRVEKIAKECNVKFKVVGRQDVLPFSPHVRKVRLDIKVN